ncbi:MAG: hypothetical protein Q7S23_00020 [bacterium]|nr:hypothetical protein [bacterium]
MARPLTIATAETQLAAYRREMAHIQRRLKTGDFTPKSKPLLERRLQKLPRLIYELSQQAGFPVSNCRAADAATARSF